MAGHREALRRITPKPWRDWAEIDPVIERYLDCSDRAERQRMMRGCLEKYGLPRRTWYNRVNFLLEQRSPTVPRPHLGERISLYRERLRPVGKSAAEAKRIVRELRQRIETEGIGAVKMETAAEWLQVPAAHLDAYRRIGVLRVSARGMVSLDELEFFLRMHPSVAGLAVIESAR